MTMPRLIRLTNGGPKDGDVWPLTQPLRPGGDVIQVADLDDPSVIHAYERREGETAASYRGCFPRSIQVLPKTQDD
jgi:hypothetical protein